MATATLSQLSAATSISSTDLMAVEVGGELQAATRQLVLSGDTYDEESVGTLHMFPLGTASTYSSLWTVTASG